MILKNLRDYYYEISNSHVKLNDPNWELYKEYRNEYNAARRRKQIEFFKSKTASELKQNFYKYYSSSISIKSDKTNKNNNINLIMNGDKVVTEPSTICDSFNSFFTTLSSKSLANHDRSTNFIDKIFKQMKNNNKIISNQSFNFNLTSETTVLNFINSLDKASGPGISDIPTKIIKLCSSSLTPLLTNLFNAAILQSKIPNEWKFAVVTPLFKNKGDVKDINNYRGISVLPPIAKIFEKILSEQISYFFNSNMLFFAGQHGFRRNHSCETALHELLSELNVIRDKKMIALLLFIDFRKAFDLVDSNLLILKLFHYGFGNSALNLVKNYFENREQIVKIGRTTSSTAPLSLGVPQGSCLGPLFFIIFINDLPMSIGNLECKMFADDTTLLERDENLNRLQSKFIKSLENLIDWCFYNRLDINWQKTQFMFVTNKRIKTPKSIFLGDQSIEVVDTFKLLGIAIDNKLNFLKHVAKLRRSINVKLFTIKRLFYLSTSVKIQFFKTFIMPLFDYCSTLFIYFPKSSIQKLKNCYDFCLLKLFKFKIELYNVFSEKFESPSAVNKYYTKLQSYGISTLEHRFIIRASSFVHKIFNSYSAPSLLSEKLQLNKDHKSYRLRNCNNIIEPNPRTIHGGQTFSYFFSKLINNIFLDTININFEDFKTITFNNINNIYIKFIKYFENFDLNYRYTNLYR